MDEHTVRTLMTAILVLVVTAFHPTLAEGQDSGVSLHPMIGEVAPAFVLEEVANGKLSLESLKGRYVVLHFGASW